MPDPTTAHARYTDPETSHKAAASITDLTRSQKEVYACMMSWGGRSGGYGMADWQLIDSYRRNGYLPQSDSGIRTRRSELVKLGLVRDTGRRRTGPLNRGSYIVWEALAST